MATKNETPRIPDISAELIFSTNDGQINDAVVFTFRDGSSSRVAISQLPDQVLRIALLHGLKQKIGDAAAISRDPTTGRTVDLAVKKAAVHAMIGELIAGNWHKPRTGSGTGGSTSLLFQALIRLYQGKKTPEQIRNWLDTKSPAEQAALRRSAQLSPIIDEIKAERDKGSAGVDVDALLGGLED